MSKLLQQCLSHLEPVQDETEEIELSLETSEGGEDDWTNKYDVAETQQTQGPGSPHVSAVQLSPGLGNAENYNLIPPFSSNLALSIIENDDQFFKYMYLRPGSIDCRNTNHISLMNEEELMVFLQIL